MSNNNSLAEHPETEELGSGHLWSEAEMMEKGKAQICGVTVSRRDLLTGAGVCILQSSSSAWAQNNRPPIADPKSIAIVDTPQDVRCYIDQLAAAGVQVIGRYYARKKQDALPQKRISHNVVSAACGDNTIKKSEAAAILGKEMAILSVYQYSSNTPLKFLFGIDRKGDPIRTGRRGSDHIAIARAEADLDADAAVDQARKIGQPSGTAIYFGLDFNLREANDARVTYQVKEPDLDEDGDQKRDEKGVRLWRWRAVDAIYTDRSPVSNRALKSACVAYFSRIMERLGAKFRIGVYGNGYAADLLSEKRKIDYVWLSGSLGYEGTVKKLKSGGWHLFQNNLDRKWFVPSSACSGGLDIDANMQNPDMSDFGAWNRGGVFRVESKRTAEIARSRIFAAVDVPIFLTPSSEKPSAAETCLGRKSCSQVWVRRNRNVRLLGTDLAGEWLEIDLDEDGKRDGYCPAKVDGRTSFVRDLRQMPDWTGQDGAKGPVCK